MPTLLLPYFDHPAIEERFAAWQTRELLSAGGVPVRYYDPADAAREVAGQVEDEVVIVVTDPLLLPSPHLVTRLVKLLETAGADAVVPILNEPVHPGQLHAPPSYVTLRELHLVAAELEAAAPCIEHVVWDDSNPFLFACDTVLLDDIRLPMERALRGHKVAISHNDYVHRWASMRGQVRSDLLSRVPLDAKSILEFGCGEAPLGAALKQRQPCRVVGIELDQHAAAVARKRIDDVYCGDVREIVRIIKDSFDWIIGGDIVEHLDDPWSFLHDLRRITAKGGHLLLSLPNIANAAVISDLLAGRFDYVYMGLTCVGHLRFFTRHSITEMLSIARWTTESIEPQETIPSIGGDPLVQALEAAGLPFSRDDLFAPGYYVIARNDG